MPARSIGTATISFGLVSVPVSIYSASESKASVSFNMLHKKCGSRLKQQYICPKDNNEVVTRDDTVKGYEYAKDQYVVLTAEELKALEEKATSTIDVLEFVRSRPSIGNTWTRSTTSAPTREATAPTGCSRPRSRKPGVRRSANTPRVVSNILCFSVRATECW